MGNQRQKDKGLQDYLTLNLCFNKYFEGNNTYGDLNFNLLSPAMLYRMKYKDSKKSGKYLIACINLMRYFVLRLRIAFIK